ncbi:MAG: hypothetical protein Q3M24_10085 [Candidatus Electrothrix aestuarii]|uniref:Uncharacterized protein n=1 Tax=Candidatus Electrothrix aestuarii TaxID=3062594 RepID=A0AAU8M1Q6_9BACT|nr:hypothetical protein [Candidatus Electrothrix aestuarii]
MDTIGQIHNTARHWHRYGQFVGVGREDSPNYISSSMPLLLPVAKAEAISGQWALDCAQQIGTDVVTEYLKKMTTGM